MLYSAPSGVRGKHFSIAVWLISFVRQSNEEEEDEWKGYTFTASKLLCGVLAVPALLPKLGLC